MRWLRVLVAVALLGIMVSDASPAAGFPGANGRTVWVLRSDGSDSHIYLDLFTAQPDGSGRRQLTKNQFVEQAIVDPSGRLVAYWTPTADGFEVGVVGIKSHASMHVLTDATLDWLFLTWSPDGKLYAVMSHVGDPAYEFVRLGMNGVITPVSTLGSLVVFSPVAHRVLTSTAGGGPATVSDPRGGHPVVVGNAYTLPAWAPDGSRIALPTASAITIVNADGTNPQTFPISDPGLLWWSPDGTTIVYSAGGAIHPDGTPATGPTAPSPPPGYLSSESRFYDWAPRP
ncbi:MAG: hypothetical protein QOH79_3887 [Acidimicrobiaceae bacterium]|jgi:hypothetical protein